MIEKLKCFNLKNAEGERLRLYLGQDRNLIDSYGSDNGYRWCFIGTKIPMPVRNGTWFNGFPEATMMNWLMDNGWIPETAVDMQTGKATIFNVLISDPEPDKGNVNFATDLSDSMLETYVHNLNEVIRFLCKNEKKVSAIRLYRLYYGGRLVDAKNAVDHICGI